MVKPRVNYFVDIFLGLSFIFAGLSGIIMFFVHGRTSVVLGISLGVWSEIHEWAGFILVGLVLLHLILHFKWICSMTKDLFVRKK